MNPNMSLDDLMNALAHWGTVTIQRIRFPKAASKNLKGKPVQWSAEIRIPGYQNEYGQPYFKFRGSDLREVVEKCYDAAETYLYSDEGRQHRRAALDERDRHNAWAKRDNPHDLPSNGGAPRQRGPVEPDVIGPDAPPIDKEVYE